MKVTGSGELAPHYLRLSTEEQPTADNPNPLRATYVSGSAADEFVADHFDSNGGRARQRSSGWQGDALVFERTITMNGATVPLRDTFTRLGSDTYHHTSEIDLGRGSIPVDEKTATRFTPSAA